jgi:ABC-type lipoprotein export system ATPase subunit
MPSLRRRTVVDKLKERLEERKYEATLFVTHDEAIDKVLELAMYLMAVKLEEQDARA